MKSSRTRTDDFRFNVATLGLLNNHAVVLVLRHIHADDTVTCLGFYIDKKGEQKFMRCFKYAKSYHKRCTEVIADDCRASFTHLLRSIPDNALLPGMKYMDVNIDAHGGEHSTYASWLKHVAAAGRIHALPKTAVKRVHRCYADAVMAAAPQHVEELQRRIHAKAAIAAPRIAPTRLPSTVIRIPVDGGLDAFPNAADDAQALTNEGESADTLMGVDRMSPLVLGDSSAPPSRPPATTMDSEGMWQALAQLLTDDCKPAVAPAVSILRTRVISPGAGAFQSRIGSDLDDDGTGRRDESDVDGDTDMDATDDGAAPCDACDLDDGTGTDTYSGLSDMDFGGMGETADDLVPMSPSLFDDLW